MTHDALLVFAAFAASAVEMVEAATIVLAVGITYSWRTSLWGVAAALALLAVVTAALGPALFHFVPINVLQIVIGSLLLVFGLQWLSKAVLRAAHIRAQRNEESIFKHEIEELQAMRRTAGDSQTAGFIISFKGVFLEGLEVAFIVITFGAASGRTGLAAAGAAAAVIVVGIAAVLAHRPLSKVPENTIKMAVGLLLVSFGTFWGGQGVGIEWWSGDAMILILLGVYAAVTLGASAALSKGLLKRRPAAPAKPASANPRKAPWPVQFAQFWYDFLVGNSKTLVAGGSAGVVAAWLLVQSDMAAGGEFVLPAAVVTTLGVSVLWR